MANKVISGLTITIGADTQKFNSAMKELDREARNIAKDLKAVSQSLKLDPGDSESYANKLKLLQDAANNATKRVDAIKQAIANLNKQFSDSQAKQDLYNQSVKELDEALKSGKITQEDYKKSLDAVKKEYGTGLISQKDYEASLKDLQGRLESATYEQNLAVNALDSYQRETSDTAKDVDKLGDEQKETNKEMKDFSTATQEGTKGAFSLADAIKAHLTSEAILSALRRLRDLVVTLGRELIEAGKQLFNFSKDAVSMAAAYEDATGYAETVYGNFSDSVLEWVDSNSERLRIYKGDLLEYMNSFGQVFKVQGLTESDAMKMAENLISLSADIRAATGKNTTEINELLQRGLTSSLRNFRQLGVIMSEASVKAYALDQGLVSVSVDQTKLADATLKVSEAQKKANDALAKYGEDSLEFQRAEVNLTKAEEKLEEVLEGKLDTMDAGTRSTAIYMLLLESLQNIVGQNEKEAGLYNSQLELTKTKLKNLKETIGEQLLPVFTDLITQFNAFLDTEEGQALIQSIVDQFKEWGDTIQKMADDGTISKFLSDTAERIPQIVDQIGDLVTQIIDLIPQITELTEQLLNLFGIDTEAEKAKKSFMLVADQIEDMAETFGISTETARTAINEFAQTNNKKLSEIYGDWDKYEPLIIAFMGDVSGGAKDLEENYKAHLETLPEATKNAITDISTTDMSPLETFLYNIGHSIGTWVDYYVGKWNEFKNLVMSGTDENPEGQPGWGDDLALDPDFVRLNAGMASGGPVKAGRLYRVNDDAGRRTEWFVPSQNGYILNGNQADRIVNNSNSQSFSGGINIYVNSYGMNVAEVADELGAAFSNKIRMSGAML